MAIHGDRPGWESFNSGGVQRSDKDLDPGRGHIDDPSKNEEDSRGLPWNGEYQHGSVITSILKCGMKLLIHTQTSTVTPLQFGKA